MENLSQEIKKKWVEIYSPENIFALRNNKVRTYLLQTCLVFSLPHSTPEYGFILSEEDYDYSLLIYPGEFYQTERSCFKDTIDRNKK